MPTEQQRLQPSEVEPEGASGGGASAKSAGNSAGGSGKARHQPEYDEAPALESGGQRSELLLKEAQTASKSAPPSRFQKIQGAILPVVVLVIIIGLVVMLFIINSTPAHHAQQTAPVDYVCHDKCSLALVESIPTTLAYNGSTVLPSQNANQSTYSSWANLIGVATTTIDIASYSFVLQPSTNTSSGSEGRDLYAALLAAGIRKVTVRIVQDSATNSSDADALAAAGAATVRKVNFATLFGMGGSQDASFVVVDGKHVYVGSADMDWRSLTQVKDLGVAMYDCACLATDLDLVFSQYWTLGVTNATLPTSWPASSDTSFNATAPLNVTFGIASSAATAGMYFSSSPAAPFNTPSRSADADAIVAVLSGATVTADIAISAFSPVTSGNTFWPTIDNAVRGVAAGDAVNVRLLVSATSQQQLPYEVRYLRSLADFSSRILVRLFVSPNTSETQPTRLNNNNYMVTDSVAYLGTSDWMADNFVNSARVGLVANETGLPQSVGLRAQLQAVFERDWASTYAFNLSSVVTDSMLASLG